MFLWWLYFFNMLISALISSSSSSSQTHKHAHYVKRKGSVRYQVRVRVRGTYACDVHDLNSSELTSFDMAAL